MLVRILGLALIAATTACASGGGSALFRKDVGNGSGPDVLRITRNVLEQYSYEIAQSDTINGIRIETEWRKRQPFSDESALGIQDAESRILINARPRGQTVLGANYSVNVTVENRLRVQGTSSWNESLNTAMFTAYATKITDQMKQLFTNVGVRVY
jgi:hypothetical protein